MAGDWLKMECCLPEKPEVFQIAGIMGIHPDEVFGKLFKVWRWFDAHTEFGNAHSVTYALVDHVAGVTGFAEAMAFVGWLVQDGRDLVIPNFDRHNGKTAKDRGLTAKRVAKTKAKGNASTNGTVTLTPLPDALPREEKRREEKKEQKQAPATPSALVEVPDWVPADAWAGFVENRKKIRHPLTSRAAKLVLAELVRLKASGHPPGAVLDQSTRNGWRDVFELRAGQASGNDAFGGAL